MKSKKELNFATYVLKFICCTRWKRGMMLILLFGLINFTYILNSQIKVWRLVKLHPVHGQKREVYPRQQIPNSTENNNVKHIDTDNDQVCVHPILKPFDDHVMPYIRPEPPFVCSGESDWITIQNNSIFLKIPPEISAKKGEISCGIQYVERDTDYKIQLSPGERLSPTHGTPMKNDFFKVSCSDDTYMRFHAGISPNPAPLRQHNKWAHGLGMNVFMLGLDSVSHMSFLRNLPKSYDYLTNTMGGIVLDGYNIVGDATFNALCPMLTGKSPTEIPKIRKQLEDGVLIDELPFIWNKYKEEGYVTAFSEEQPDISVLAGFKNKPTDHFMRPYYLATKEAFKIQSKFCYGSKHRFNIFLDWFKLFFKTYKDQPTFGFGFNSEQSHSDNLNLVGTLDKDLHEGLKSLYEEGYLDNTIFMLFSDHGSRFSGMRATLQGKQEERLPFFALVFPKWFKEKYSRAYKSVLTNAKRLSSPFDIHATLQDILTYAPQDVGNTTQRGISLFQEIPKSRSCEDAKIDDHWCACLKWKKISTNDTVIKVASQSIIDYINNLTFNHRSLCEERKVEKITQALQLNPTEGLKKFKGTIKDDHTNPDLSDDMADKKTTFQISFYAEPGNALFEATVDYVYENNQTLIKANDISRLNKYGKTADCVSGIKNNIRKFCYCKNQ